MVLPLVQAAVHQRQKMLPSVRELLLVILVASDSHLQGILLSVVARGLIIPMIKAVVLQLVLILLWKIW